MVGPEEVRRIARLARLSLSPEEASELSGQLGGILAWVEQLRAAEADAGPGEDAGAAAAPSGGARRLRPDVPGETLPRADVLAQAPGADGETFRVPPVLEDAP